MTSLFSQSIRNRRTALSTGPMLDERGLDQLIAHFDAQERVEEETSRMRAVAEAVRQYGLVPEIMAAVDVNGDISKAVGISSSHGLESLGETDRELQAEILISSIDGFVDEIDGMEARGFRAKLHTKDGGGSTLLGMGLAGGLVPCIVDHGVRLKMPPAQTAIVAAIAGVASFTIGKLGGMGSKWTLDRILNGRRIYGSVEQVKEVLKQYSEIGETVAKLIAQKPPTSESAIPMYEHTIDELAEKLIKLGVPVKASGKTTMFSGRRKFTTPYSMVKVSSGGWNEHTSPEMAKEFTRVVNDVAEKIHAAQKEHDREDAPINGDIPRAVRKSRRRADQIALRAIRHLIYLYKDTGITFKELKNFFTEAEHKAEGEGGHSEEGGAKSEEAAS